MGLEKKYIVSEFTDFVSLVIHNKFIPPFLRCVDVIKLF